MIFRACERFGIRPPESAKSWEETNFWGQAYLLAFNAIREQEEAESSPAEAIGIAMAAMAGHPR